MIIVYSAKFKQPQRELDYISFRVCLHNENEELFLKNIYSVSFVLHN